MKNEKRNSAARHIFSLLLAFVIVLLMIDLIGIEFAPEGKAVATHVEGTITLFPNGSGEGRLLRENDTVGKNDQVVVQENSRIELRCPEGSYLRLAEKTRLIVRLLQFQKRTNSMNLQVLLDAGKLWFRLKQPATGSSVEVLTDTAITSGEGAVYAVDREENASTTVKVYEGAVQAARAPSNSGGGPGQGQSLTLKTYQRASVASAEAVPLARDFDPKATINDWIRWNLQRDAREGLISVTLSPAASTLSRGSSLQLTGTANYPDNSTKDVTWFATWGSSDMGVATIDQAGLALAGKPGNSNMSAAIVDINGSGTLTVSNELLSIAVTPAAPSIVNGSVQQFRAMGKFSDNTLRDITSSVAWTSSIPSIAAINGTGLATAGNKAGTAIISASQGNKTANARLAVRRELLSVTVEPDTVTLMEGEARQLRALANFSDKTTEDITSSAKWRLSDTKIASINSAGLVTGKSGAGTASVTALFRKKTGSGNVLVAKPAPVPVARKLVSLSIQPAAVSVRQMMSQQFSATGSYSDGSTQDLTGSVAWNSEAPLIVQMKPTGKALAIMTGAVAVTASYEGLSGSGQVTVLPREIYRPRADAETAKKFVYWPAPRFSKAEGARFARGAVVIDSVTNLVWMADAATPGPKACTPGVQKKWQEAVQYVKCLNENAYLGSRNWRLPSREELFSILDYKQSVPNQRVYSEGFCYTQGFYGYEVWFSTNEGIPTYADLGLGVGYYTEDAKSFYVWPVRSVK